MRKREDSDAAIFLEHNICYGNGCDYFTCSPWIKEHKYTNKHCTNTQIPKPTIIIQNNFIVAFYGAIWDWLGDKIMG